MTKPSQAARRRFLLAVVLIVSVCIGVAIWQVSNIISTARSNEHKETMPMVVSSLPSSTSTSPVHANQQSAVLAPTSDVMSSISASSVSTATVSSESVTPRSSGSSPSTSSMSSHSTSSKAPTTLTVTAPPAIQPVSVSEPLGFGTDSTLLPGFSTNMAAMPYPHETTEVSEKDHLEPPKGYPHTVFWVQDATFGSAPGTNATDTVYYLCHSWSVEYRSCNPIAEKAVQSPKVADTRSALAGTGDPVAVQSFHSLDGVDFNTVTQKGTLTYQVEQSFTVAKAEAWRIALIQETKPGRLILITCATDGDTDLDFNVVVVMNLVRAVPN